MASELEDRPFYNIFDGLHGRTESTYLDIQERVEAERSRAVAEGREPDLTSLGNLPAATGTPMVPEERRVDNRFYSNPSVQFTGYKDVDPVATLPVDVGTADDDVDLSYAAQVARERSAQDEALLSDTTVDADTSTSTDSTVNADFNTTDTRI